MFIVLITYKAIGAINIPLLSVPQRRGDQVQQAQAGGEILEGAGVLSLLALA